MEMQKKNALKDRIIDWAADLWWEYEEYSDERWTRLQTITLILQFVGSIVASAIVVLATLASRGLLTW